MTVTNNAGTIGKFNLALKAGDAYCAHNVPK